MIACHKAPFFSVVISAYNAERFLGETLDSVLGQTFEDVQVVVCDDASTDGTAEILESYGDRIHVVRLKENRGPAGGRNAGVVVARGEYVAFIDADDLWPPDKLERCHQVIVQKGMPFVFSRKVKIDAVGRGREGGESVLPRAWRTVSPPADALLLLVNYVLCSSVVVRRSLLGDAPFDEAVALRSFEDHMLWMELNRTIPLYCIDAPLVKYRVHGDNLAPGHRTPERLAEYLSYVESRGWFSASLLRVAHGLARFHWGAASASETVRLLGSIAHLCATHPRLCAAVTSYYTRHLIQSRTPMRSQTPTERIREAPAGQDSP